MELNVGSDDFSLPFAFSLESSGRWPLFQLSFLGAGVWRKSNWRIQRTFYFSVSLSLSF